jgi:hypothetical protein
MRKRISILVMAAIVSALALAASVAPVFAGWRSP